MKTEMQKMAMYDREISRRLRHRRLKAAGEIAGGVFTAVLFAVLALLFLAATPDQFSAESEILRAELEAQGK